jgi:Xaa-Pro aminopeptidase
MRTSSVPPAVFAARRARLFEAMGEGVALLFAAPEATLGHDITYRYRPDPDIYYLTGFPEPEAVALLDASRRTLTLFVRVKDQTREAWEGRRAGPEGAVRDFGADRAHPIGELKKRLPHRLRDANVLFFALGLQAEPDRIVAEMLGAFRRRPRDPRRGPTAVRDVTVLLHGLRLVKGPEEIAALTRSCAVAARAHRDAMARVRPGMFEYELEALLERRFKAGGAAGPSYPTIVASGENATILHYIENRRRIGERDLVLVDAGCEVEGYASDITRTFPASGRFTRPARRLYDVVLAAQAAALAKVKPGTRFDAVHEAAREVLLDGLIDVGLLRGRRATLKARNAAQRFCLHQTSHWLGLDVHDRGRYVEANGKGLPLQAGMVLTVEPGLYVRKDEKRVPDAYRGLGIRIEDDVLVTGDGHRVLTDAAPKEPEAVMALAGRGRS